MRRFIILGFLWVWLAQFSSLQAADPGHSTYLQQLLKQASSKQLHEHDYWHLLLHYLPQQDLHFESEADGEFFFLSTNGKTNPKAELEATLAAFFSKNTERPSQQTAQCAFPLRYQWLKEQLTFDSQYLPEQQCDRFQQWIQALKPKSATLIFATAYLNHPASAFGHTLLRIDRDESSPSTKLLDYVINFAADADTTSAWDYVIGGMTGRFPGKFSIMPYYMKIQEYSELENRDIWEYELNLSQKQLQTLLMHAWELGSTHFDYYFFKENCSYHLLSLIEAAAPEFKLRTNFHYWTIPSATIQLIAAQPGLVRSRHYRPARSTRLQKQLVKLPKAETRWLRHLVSEFQELKPAPHLSKAQQIQTLDIAIDYLRYQTITGLNYTPKVPKRYQELLTYRSQHSPSKKTERKQSIPGAKGPDEGHLSQRLGIGLGFFNQDVFQTFEMKPSYHQLLDLPDGYLPHSEVDLAHVVLRHYEAGGQWALHQWVPLNLQSYFPYTEYLPKPSWRFKVSIDSFMEKGACQYCNYLRGEAGIGYSKELRRLGGFLFYNMIDWDVGLGSMFDDWLRLGVGYRIGGIFKLSEKMMLHVRTKRLFYSDSSPTSTINAIDHQLMFSRNTAIRLSAESHNENRSLQAAWFYYF